MVNKLFSMPTFIVIVTNVAAKVRLYFYTVSTRGTYVRIDGANENRKENTENKWVLKSIGPQ